MKKLFAVLLALGMLFAFAACGRDKPVPTTTEPASVTTETKAPSVTAETEPSDIPETEPPSESETETTVAEGPVDPTTLNSDKAALVAYFNEAANRVRSEKPAFTYEMTNKVINPKIVGGIASILNPVIPRIVSKLMPGDTEYFNMAKGKDNSEHFLSLEKATASSLKPGDVTSIRAEKSGANYVITVKLGSATNPKKGGASAYSRLFQIKTSKELLDDISGEDDKISGDYNNITLKYNSGNVVMTVDAQGRVQGLTGGFDVKAEAKEMKMYGFTVNFNCDQTSRIAAKKFTW